MSDRDERSRGSKPYHGGGCWAVTAAPLPRPSPPAAEPTATSQFPPCLAVTPCRPRRRRGCGGKDKEKKAPPQLPVVTAVCKIDMRCDGCAQRICASVRRFLGV